MAVSEAITTPRCVIKGMAVFKGNGEMEIFLLKDGELNALSRRLSVALVESKRPLVRISTTMLWRESVAATSIPNKLPLGDAIPTENRADNCAERRPFNSPDKLDHFSPTVGKIMAISGQ